MNFVKKIIFPSEKEVASDTETTGLNPRHGDRPYCFSFCDRSGTTTVVSFPVDPFTREVKYDKRINKIKTYYEDPTKTFIFHNAAFDVGMLEAIGIKIKGQVICTMGLLRLVRSNVSTALKPFCEQYLGIPTEDEKELVEETRRKRAEGRKRGWKVYEPFTKSSGKKGDEQLAPDYWMAGKKLYEKYAERDAFRALALYDSLLPEIEAQGIQKLWKTELATWYVLRDIENRGIRIDKNKVINSKIKLKKKFQMYVKEAQRLANLPTLNIRSSQQLSKVLYETFKEPIRYLTAKSGNPSTESAALKAMKHPLARAVLNARACIKTVEFMSQYLRYMVYHDGEWFIHPRIHSAIALTGRESCSNPNLQQVRKESMDKALEVRVEARSVFSARKGYKLRSYDWKNIEVYIPGFKSGDKKLVAMLTKGEDVHTYTAQNLTDTVGETIDREIGKRTFFGQQYGIGVKKMAKTLGISEEIAEKIVIGFGETYSGLCNWMEKLIGNARKNGFVVTAYGRRIYVEFEAAFRAINYYVQGTAGGILKEAKVKIHHYFKKNAWDAHIVLPIHDELLIEYGPSVDPKKLDRVVVSFMQDNPELNMPVKIPVSVSAIGKNWAHKEKINMAG